MNTENPEKLGPDCSNAALEYLNNEKLTKNESLFAAISWKLWDYTCAALALLIAITVAFCVMWGGRKCGLNEWFPGVNFGPAGSDTWCLSELLASLLVPVVLYGSCKVILKWKPGRSFALRTGLAFYRCFK